MIGILITTSRLQMLQALSRPTFRFCLIIQPILYTLILMMMFQQSGKTDIVTFIVLGSGLLTLWSCICYSSAGDIERERFMGTLQVIYCTPTSFKLIMLAKIIGNTLLGLIPFVLSFIFVRFFWNEPISIHSLPKFVIGLAATIISFISVSLLMSAIFTLSRSSRILMNCLEYPIYILSGMVFPVEMLPGWLHPVSYILSPTWAVRILRLSIEGNDSNSVYYYYIAVLSAITLMYFIFANVLFNAIDKKTRIDASIGVV